MNCSVPHQPQFSHLSPSLIQQLLASAINSIPQDFAIFISILLHGPSHSGKTQAVTNGANAAGMHMNLVDCYMLLEEGLESTLMRLDLEIEKSILCQPCVLVLKGFDAFCQVWEGDVKDPFVKCMQKLSETPHIALVCLTSDIDLIHASMQRLFGIY